MHAHPPACCCLLPKPVIVFTVRRHSGLASAAVLRAVAGVLPELGRAEAGAELGRREPVVGQLAVPQQSQQ